MVEVIGVKFRADGRIYSFSPAGKKFKTGEFVIVTTSRGTECGEVASEVNHFEKSGIKVLKHGVPSKQHMADEIKQAINGLIQLAVYYGVEVELEASIDRSLEKMKAEGLL